mgnify:CR=1 FL=1
MEISDLLAHDAVVAKLNVSSKKQLLQELARIAAPRVGMDERIIFDTLLDRCPNLKAVVFECERNTMEECLESFGLLEQRLAGTPLAVS